MYIWNHKNNVKARRTLFKTGKASVASVASKKTELGVWGRSKKIVRGFRCPKLAYNNPKTNSFYEANFLSRLNDTNLSEINVKIFTNNFILK